MKIRTYLFLLLLFKTSVLIAQTHSISGEVLGEDGNPMVYASVVLLNPADSTLLFFGITNNQGHFEIKGIKENNYLMQVSFIGYQTIYRNISIPYPGGNNIGGIVMKTAAVDVGEVKVVGERIPIMIRKDTVEYNAAAFKLKSDAVTEDLLKKLPGIEVDRAGNIKAMGEDVKKLFVDGKEFFGNDPKVATKNIPAKAIDKVQVYDRKSEESMFTGISDGIRDKTINLKLQEDSKRALFGDVLAGGGTNERYQGSAKVYRFTDKVQLAALGMVNNVNQFGFSLNDYLNFSGGIGGMIHGGGSAAIRISTDGSFPINFGQPVSGLNTSGAGGMNFSYSTSPYDRAFISYLGNVSRKDLVQNTTTRNYLDTGSFFQEDNLGEKDRNEAHRLNLGLRNRIDSTQNILLNGDLSLNYGDDIRNLLSVSSLNEENVNHLISRNRDRSDRLSGNFSGSYMNKIRQGRTVLEISGNTVFSIGMSKNRFENSTTFYNNGQNQYISQFQDNKTGNTNFTAGISLTQKISRLIYLEPEIKAGNAFELLDRTQGIPSENSFVIDSLSPRFEKNYRWFRPGISLIRNSVKTKLTFAVRAENGQMDNDLNNFRSVKKNFWHITPSFSWEYEYRTGRRLVAFYSSSVNTPNAMQLLPVTNYLNPLSLYYGNPDLEPELVSRFNIHWLLIDQFSFTSLLTTLNGSWTKNKINWDRTVSDRLAQVNTLYNADHDYNLRGNADFSTPLRSLGIKLNLNLEDSWSQGLNLINKTENTYTNWSHRISLNAENRKKEKLDINSGIELTFTKSLYSVQNELNNDYFDISWFGEVSYNPNKKWNFEATADITRYTARSFGESVNIPLIGAEISRYFLKNNRGTLTLRGFDLLDMNRIVQRFSELNYLREIRANSMGRYVMLTFSYRLNRFGEVPGGIDIKIRRN